MTWDVTDAWVVGSGGPYSLGYVNDFRLFMFN